MTATNSVRSRSAGSLRWRNLCVGAAFVGATNLSGQSVAPVPVAVVMDRHRVERDVPRIPERAFVRRSRIVLGATVGAVVGGFVGYRLESSSCRGCDFRPPLIVASAVGAVLGGLIGSSVASMGSTRNPGDETPHNDLRVASQTLVAISATHRVHKRPRRLHSHTE